MDQFLNGLPKAVVKAGRVIDIRESVRDTLQVGNCRSTTPSLFGPDTVSNKCLEQGSSTTQSSTAVSLIDTEALQAARDRYVMLCDALWEHWWEGMLKYSRDKMKCHILDVVVCCQVII